MFDEGERLQTVRERVERDWHSHN